MCAYNINIMVQNYTIMKCTIAEMIIWLKAGDKPINVNEMYKYYNMADPYFCHLSRSQMQKSLGKNG